MGKPFIDLTGKKFGRLTIIKRIYPDRRKNRATWLCKCECGKEKIAVGCNLYGGSTKSCGCLKNEDKRKFSPEIAQMRQLLSKYKRRAKMRGYKFELTEKQFFKLTQQDCYYCGAKPSNIDKRPNYSGEYIYNGIDRIDNTGGYTINNVVPCCKICNYAKRNLTLQEFKDWIKRISEKILDYTKGLKK